VNWGSPIVTDSIFMDTLRVYGDHNRPEGRTLDLRAIPGNLRVGSDEDFLTWSEINEWYGGQNNRMEFFGLNGDSMSYYAKQPGSSHASTFNFVGVRQ
jgi:hypothetical protein